MADPTAANEQKHPNLNLTPEERKLFSQVFQAADKEGLGVVTGDVAIAFFPQRTKLPADVLGEIWQIADVEDKGFLTPNGFYVVLRLIGYAQAGRPVNARAATSPGPLPRFEGINTSAPGPAPLQPQGSGGPVRVPPLLPDRANRYASLFEESGAQNGLLPGTTAKQIFDRAELPNDVLVRIWNLADTERRGMLSATEFIIAMHLLASFRDGSMRALPQTLPSGLYDAAARRGAPLPRPTSGAKAISGSPTAIPRQMTGGPGRTASPLAQQAYVAPPLPAQATGQVQAPAAEGWVIGGVEKAKYDRQFGNLDPTGKGFVAGGEAVEFFSNSGLSEDDLAQIWDLADINSQGQLTKDEFAVAMHLILQRVQTKAPIPATLPANLIPPSLRNVVSQTQKSTAPEFQAQAAPASKQAQSAAEDLFGLDALSGPAPASAPPAKPQVAQSTGGSSSFATPSSPRAPGSPAQLPKSGPSTMFKPFQPSSSFGQGIVSPQPTGASAGSFARAPAAANDDLLGDNDEASRSMNNDSVEVGNLANQANTLTSQTQDLKAKKAATEQATGPMASQKRDLETRLAQMRQAYEQEARDLRAYEERADILRTENAKLQQDLAMVQHSQQNLANEHQKITDQLANDQQENARLKEQISQVNNEINQLKPQTEKVRSDARHQKGLVSINKKQLANVEAERDRLKSEVDSAMQEHADATRELEDIQSKTEALARAKVDHSRELEATRERVASATNQREEARSAFDTAQQTTIAIPAAAAVSPAPSVNSMNPFFKRSATQGSLEKAAPATGNAASSVKSPNHSAFDEFFGPSIATGSTATSPPPATFGAFSPPIETSIPTSTEPKGTRSIETPPSNDTRTRIPPSPPRPRQTSSGILPLRRDTAQAPSGTSSIGVVRSLSRQEGSPAVATPTEQQPTEPESSKLGGGLSEDTEDEPSPATSDEAQRPTLTSVKSDQVNDLPGAFPDETPFQTPTDTGSTGGMAAASLAPHGTSNDPFSSKPRTPASTRNDFDFAFSDFDTEAGKGKEPEHPLVADFPAPPSRAADTSGEFPPIQHFDNEDSDSESEHGLQDRSSSSKQTNKNLTTQRPGLERGPSTTAALPGADAQSSPPSYDATVKTEQGSHGRDSNQFPAEYKGLLPAREDPTLPSQQPHSVPSADSAIESASSPLGQGTAPFAATSVSAPGAVNPAHAIQPGHVAEPAAGKASAFDAFDDDFNDLSEAQVEETGGPEDLTASIASRRDTLDEFNPSFDSPAPSTRATGTFSDPHASVGGSAFADFESSIHSGGTGPSSSSMFGTSSQTPSNHDWDAMFAGIDQPPAKGQSNGTNAIEEAFGSGPSALASSLAPPSASKPTLARAISEGTEHDDPILKRLTGMGFARGDSLQALEKFDYNIDKAAEFLAARS